MPKKDKKKTTDKEFSFYLSFLYNIYLKFFRKSSKIPQFSVLVAFRSGLERDQNRKILFTLFI